MLNRQLTQPQQDERNNDQCRRQSGHIEPEIGKPNRIEHDAGHERIAGCDQNGRAIVSLTSNLGF
jgi:hypothetical protein